MFDSICLGGLFRDSGYVSSSLTICLTLTLSLRAATIFCLQFLFGVLECTDKGYTGRDFLLFLLLCFSGIKRSIYSKILTYFVCFRRKCFFFARIKYYHMVKQFFMDHQNTKCYDLQSRLPLKNLQ